MLRLWNDVKNQERGCKSCKRRREQKRYVVLDVFQYPISCLISNIFKQLAATIAELEKYKLLLSERPTMRKADFLTKLSEDTPFDTEAQLESWVKRTEADVRKKQRKDLGLEEEPEEVPTFPLLERPDEELNEDELKEKRRQRLMKGAWDARMKAKEEKRKERERMVSYSLCSVV